MPSPFPGMNPFLEQEGLFHDFHQTFIPFVREALNSQVRPKYAILLEEHVYIHEPSADERRRLVIPDGSIARNAGKAAQTASTKLLEAPAYAQLMTTVDTERDSYLEIRDLNSNVIVAVIELLSPTNKRTGSDREQYVAKRRQYFSSSTHVIEIDLLRGHERMPLEGLPQCDYCAIVSRAEERPRVGVWPIRLRERLPVIPIPLSAPDPDAKLDLQEVLHRVYDSAGYADRIYKGLPKPPLHPDDAKWAAEVAGLTDSPH